LDKNYLPIGSSIIVKHDHNKYLVSCPTMLTPQNVSETQNVYYATMSALYNVIINKKMDINNVDIIITSMCCGYSIV
jgi:hypothetical protein